MRQPPHRRHAHNLAAAARRLEVDASVAWAVAQRAGDRELVALARDILAAVREILHELHLMPAGPLP